MKKIKRKIKAVVFYFDDTLYPESSFQRSGFDFIAQKLRQSRMQITSREIFQLYQQYPKTLFNELADHYELPYTAQELIRLYRNHFPRIRISAEVSETLKKLKKGYKLGLLTDYFYKTQVNKVKALGIKDFFDCIIYTDKIGAPKPAIKGFKLIKEKFNAGDRKIIYVGDNEEKDFWGAKKAGFFTVKFANKDGFHSYKQMSKMHKAHYEIKKLKGIFRVLEKINQA